MSLDEPSLYAPVALNCCVAPGAIDAVAGVTAIVFSFPLPLLPHPTATNAHNMGTRKNLATICNRFEFMASPDTHGHGNFHQHAPRTRNELLNEKTCVAFPIIGPRVRSHSFQIRRGLELSLQVICQGRETQLGRLPSGNFTGQSRAPRILSLRTRPVNRQPKTRTSRYVFRKCKPSGVAHGFPTCLTMTYALHVGA